MSLLNSLILWIWGWTAARVQGGLPPVTDTLPTADTVAEFGAPAADLSVLFIKMLFAMIVVIALAFFLLRYILPKLHLRRRQDAETDVRITHRIPLNAKNALFILQVEGRRLLVAASEQQASLITELEKDYDPKDKNSSSS